MASSYCPAEKALFPLAFASSAMVFCYNALSLTLFLFNYIFIGITLTSLSGQPQFVPEASQNKRQCENRCRNRRTELGRNSVAMWYAAGILENLGSPITAATFATWRHVSGQLPSRILARLGKKC